MTFDAPKPDAAAANVTNKGGDCGGFIGRDGGMGAPTNLMTRLSALPNPMPQLPMTPKEEEIRCRGSQHT